MTSILASIKKLLGIPEEYEHYDADIIMHINSAIAVLRQLGIGPSSGYSITGGTETWADYLDNPTFYEDAKMYIYLRTRQIFDPPTSNAAMNALDAHLREYEWRLLVDYNSTNNIGGE